MDFFSTLVPYKNINILGYHGYSNQLVILQRNVNPKSEKKPKTPQAQETKETDAYFEWTVRDWNGPH